MPTTVYQQKPIDPIETFPTEESRGYSTVFR